jgi:hypothetical protein
MVVVYHLSLLLCGVFATASSSPLPAQATASPGYLFIAASFYNKNKSGLLIKKMANCGHFFNRTSFPGYSRQDAPPAGFTQKSGVQNRPLLCRFA